MRREPVAIDELMDDFGSANAADIYTATRIYSAREIAAAALRRSLSGGGAQGPQGEPGPEGPEGPPGEPGETGPAGPEGPTGPEGPRGATGDTGPQGIEGPQGSQGVQGNPGPKGDTGDAGLQGPQGDTGAQGIKGDTGDTGPEGPAGASGVDVGLAWPVGSVFISVLATNPATLLGIGTWTQIAGGRMLVGQTGSDADFDTAEETGGSKTHTLTTAEMPSHTHVQDAHTHTQNAHNHVMQRFPTATGGSTGFTVDTSMSGTPAAANNTADTTAVNQNATAVNQNTGGGGAHNNMPPWFTVYIWKRTA